MINRTVSIFALCITLVGLSACNNGIGLGIEIPVGNGGEVTVQTNGKGGTKVGVGVTVQN